MSDREEVILTTARLTLRPFREDDLDAYYEMCSDSYAFTELDRRHVISLIHPRNRASIAVAERLGERYEESIEFFGETISVYGIWRPVSTPG